LPGKSYYVIIKIILKNKRLPH